MFVVPDSSIICQDLRFAGTQSKVLLGNHRVVPVTLAVPEVVIDEVTNHFRERLAKAVNSVRDSHKTLKSLVSDAPKAPPTPTIEQETAHYREFLLKQIADVGGRKAELTGEEFHGRASGRACRLARASLA